MVVSGDEDDKGQARFLFQQLLDDAESVETGHLHVQKYELRLERADHPDGFRAVLPLRDHFHVRETFEEECEFVARRLFIIDNQRRQLHGSHRSFLLL